MSNELPKIGESFRLVKIRSYEDLIFTVNRIAPMTVTDNPCYSASAVDRKGKPISHTLYWFPKCAMDIYAARNELEILPAVAK